METTACWVAPGTVAGCNKRQRDVTSTKQTRWLNDILLTLNSYSACNG